MQLSMCKKRAVAPNHAKPSHRAKRTKEGGATRLKVMTQRGLEAGGAARGRLKTAGY